MMKRVRIKTTIKTMIMKMTILETLTPTALLLPFQVMPSAGHFIARLASSPSLRYVLF
jgi:hypothetical protein